MNFIYFSLGIIFLQLIYISAHYTIFRQKEFLYFIFFSISITAFCMLSIFPILNPFDKLKGEDVFSSRYGFIFIAIAMYLKFLRIFLDLEILYPKFNKYCIIFEKIATPAGISIFLFGMLSLQHISYIVFAVLYSATLPFFLIIILYLGSRKRTINRIILAGTFLAFVIARSAVIKHFVTGDQQFQMISFEYIITAIVVLFLFLNLGLLYKSKLIQNQIIQMEIQKQSALNHQRMMISADLHDDMGASLSSIHLNAITAIKSLSDNIPQTEQILKRLVEDLKSVIENMGDIIWAINPDKQTFKPISAQLKDSYFDLMDDYNIQCNYNIDNKLEAQITNINARKNLILIAKEAINNILKHAKSSNIDISLYAEESNIVLKIQDNGIGIRDTENNFSGNGLRNMKFRTEKMNGTLTIKSEKEKGTIISCIVPIANIHYTNRENLD